MHVTFAESLDNSPLELLSFPAQNAGHYFAKDIEEIIPTAPVDNEAVVAPQLDEPHIVVPPRNFSTCLSTRGYPSTHHFN